MVLREIRTAHVTAAGAKLRELLTLRPGYQQLWVAKAVRLRGGELNLAGVARVIADYLWETGERSERDVELPRDLKDRVRRALNGEVLSAETLSWFVSAFGFTETDSEAVWAAFTNAGPSSSVGISSTVAIPRAMAKPQWHRTVALFERYTIAADGSLARRRTLHTIMAMEPGVDSYLFNHEPDVEEVRVVHGGTLGRRYSYGNGLTSDDIVLDRPLQRGETTSMEYELLYPPGRLQVCEVRRAARARAENVDIAVRFETPQLPRQVMWAVWADHYDGTPLYEEPVTATAERTYRYFVPYIEHTVVGFRWVW